MRPNVTPAPIWYGSPKRSNISGKDSTWLLAAASAIIWGNPEILTSKYTFGGESDSVQSTTITIFDQWQNGYQQELQYSTALFRDFSVNDNDDSVLENAVIQQQDGDWIKNGQFVSDQWTPANAATGLWKITGKPADVTYDTSYDNILSYSPKRIDYWFSRINQTPIVVKLKSTNRFYDVRGEVNDGNI
uniref:Uncharacterized protein n=1 Tax=Kwoniella pini CBS 10737 TaxID=1296096 RepID=A0A1B9IB66_9TREE|nr:uncharacterized protein I206_00092 [Kwoniella pini CBS 10737]OCF52796.1 hypothetical protein I206_00092 [Kwoniella pini CBS 10737]